MLYSAKQRRREMLCSNYQVYVINVCMSQCEEGCRFTDQAHFVKQPTTINSAVEPAFLPSTTKRSRDCACVATDTYGISARYTYSNISATLEGW